MMTISGIDLTALEFHEILISAVRYALGRMTYIVSDTVNIVSKNIKNLDDATICCIERDIRKHPEMGGDYGMDIDERCWMLLLSKLNKEIDERKLKRWM